MNISIDHKGLAHLAGELNALSTKKNPTAADTARRSALQSTISVLKMGGITLDEINQRAANELAVEMGKAPTQFNPHLASPEDISHAKAWRSIVRNRGRVNYEEFRDEGIGHVAQSYYNGNVGSFVPTRFLDQVFAAMKQYDPLMDPDAVTYIETPKGEIIELPMYDDTSENASVAAEGSDQSGNETDIAIPGAALVGAYSYRSPLWRASMEALQDLDTSVSLLNLFKSFAAERIARGAGRDLMNGNGSSKPVGLLNQLAVSGVTPVIASGAANNDGGAETGTNSVGTQDLASLYFSVDPIYRAQPKCAFVMHDSTLKSLFKLLDKYGRPIVDFVYGTPMIYGKRVLISPNMPQLGAAANVVIFGDMSFWVTRCSRDAQTRVQAFFQAPGLAEKGEVGLRMFARYDGALMFSNWTTPPMAVLQCHS